MMLSTGGAFGGLPVYAAAFPHSSSFHTGYDYPSTYTSTASYAAAQMSYFPVAYDSRPVQPMMAATAITPLASPQGSTSPAATYHHLAHLASTVLASLRQLSDDPRRALRRRLHRLLTAAALHSNCTLLGLYYLRRASQLPGASPSAYDLATPEEQFLAALILAQKWCEDAAYTCRTWSELAVDTIPSLASSADEMLPRMNAVERALLARLDWELRVDHVEFANWCDRLGRWASNSSSPTTATCAPVQPMHMLTPPQMYVMAAPVVMANVATSPAQQMQSMMPRPWSPAYGTYTTSCGYTTGLATTSFTGFPATAPFTAATGLWAVPGA